MSFRACVLSVVLLIARSVYGAEHTKDSVDTVKENLAGKKAVLLDVREKREWDEGHLLQAVLFPLSELRRLENDEELQKKLASTAPKTSIIYCHCGSGVRVLSAATILEKLGYTIRPLSLGFSDLKDAGFEVAK